MLCLFRCSDEEVACAYDRPWSELAERELQAAQLLGMSPEDFLDEPEPQSPSTPSTPPAAAASTLSLSPATPTFSDDNGLQPAIVQSGDQATLSISCTAWEEVPSTSSKPHTCYVLHVSHGVHEYDVRKRWAELYDDLIPALSKIKWKKCTGLRWDEHRSNSKKTLSKKMFSSSDAQEFNRRKDEINTFLGSVSHVFQCYLVNGPIESRAGCYTCPTQARLTRVTMWLIHLVACCVWLHATDSYVDG